MSFYSFNVETAAQYGVDEAIVIHNFQFWITKNKANGKHFHDGKTWTYNSQEALAKLFPFWSKRQIQRIMKSIFDSGILVKGDYNKRGYDKTMWYAFQDEGDWLHTAETLKAPNGAMSESNTGPNGATDSTKRCHGQHQTVPPIPDSKPDSKPDIKKAKKQPITFQAFLEDIKALGEQAIPKDDPIFEYAEKAGIEKHFLLLAWEEFKVKYLRTGKKYKDWRMVFRESVRANWFKLWWFDAGGKCELTSLGRQSENYHNPEAV